MTATTVRDLGPPELDWTAKVKRRYHPVPTVLQMEATECGAASLAMILAAHGLWVPLEELRAACGVSRDGANARSIKIAAKQYGMVADGYRRDLPDLCTHDLPVIAFWRFAHFVVIEGVDRKGLRVNDPALGRMRVSWEEADRDFTGLVVQIKPGPDFQPGGRPASTMASLRRRISGSAAALAYLAIAGLALAIPVTLSPMALQGYVDKVVVQGVDEWLPVTLATLVVSLLLTLWLTWWQSLIARRLSLALSQRQAVNLVAHSLRLPMSFFAQRYAGDVAFRVRLADTVADTASSQLIPGFVGLVTALAVGLLMLAYSWPLAIVAGLAGLIVVLTLRLSSRWRQAGSARYGREQAAYTGSLAYGLRSIETVKASGTEDDFFVAASGRHANVVNSRSRLEIPGLQLVTVTTVATSMATALCVAGGGLLVVSGHLTPGGYVAVLALLPLFLGPLMTWTSMSQSLQDTRTAMTRLDDLLDQPVDPGCTDWNEPRTGSPVPLDASPVLEVRDLTFGYSTTAPATVRGVSFTVSPGRRVALVGASGSGKSTIARLAVGLLRPWSGEVSLAGVAITEVPREDRVRMLSYVDQEIVLFAGSVRDNITMFAQDTPEDQVIAAARGAAIDAEIAARPGGYDSAVAESGRNFSGGQQQRIEIARALAAQPRLLILDEATSALDPIVEEQVMQACVDSGAGLLIVAHRLSTVRDCDEIIVLERGAVVERGNHAQLMAANGRYRALVSS